MKNNLENNT